MYINENHLRMSLNLEDSDIIIPVDLENIELKSNIVKQLEQGAEEIAKEYFYKYEDVICALTERVYISGSNSLIIVLDLPQSTHYVEIDSSDWRYIKTPTYQ